MTLNLERSVATHDRPALMERFRARVIGGTTGATEGSWFFVLLWIGAAAIMYVTSIVLAVLQIEHDADQSVNVLLVAGGAVVGIWCYTHGIKNAGLFGFFDGKRRRDTPDEFGPHE